MADALSRRHEMLTILQTELITSLESLPEMYSTNLEFGVIWEKCQQEAIWKQCQQQANSGEFHGKSTMYSYHNTS